MGKQYLPEASNTMKLLCITPVLLSLLGSSQSQLKFGGSSSSGSQASSNTKQSQTDTKFFTGNEGLDGGIIGGGGGGGGNGCGRRRRQADGTNTKFLGAL